MSTQPVHKLTPEEYLEIERKAEVKSEYYNGEMFAMSGASFTHARIVRNLLVSLTTKLKGKKCEATASDLRLRVSPTSLYTYSDIIVTCGEPQFADSKPDTLTNPTLIAEVLSDSTRDYDLGRKFEHYRTVDSLREYLTVDQDAPKVTHWVRGPGESWSLIDYSDLTATISLPSLGCDLSMAEIYEDVDFTV